MRRLLAGSALLGALAVSVEVGAVAVTARVNAPHSTGAEVDFDANAVGTGAIEFSWDFGDGTVTEYSGESRRVHRYENPGHYPVIVRARDSVETKSDSFLQSIHRPLASELPLSSSSIVYSAALERVCVANPDHGSVTCISTDERERVFVATVGHEPRTLAFRADGSLWVTSQGDDSLVHIDSEGEVIDTVALDYGSRPFGVVVNPATGNLLVTLQGKGELAECDGETGEILATVDAGRLPTGIALSGDGKRTFVSRFISRSTQGELVEVDTRAFEVARTLELALDPGPDTEAGSRGVPNYLRSLVLSPDLAELWVPSKKDNVLRGTARDGLALTFETSVRSIVSIIELAESTELLDERIDVNNRGLGLAATFSPLGDYVFVAFTATNGVEVFDTYSRQIVSGVQDLGCKAPDGLVLDEQGYLYVHCFLSRNVVVLDASGILSSEAFGLEMLDEVATESDEVLSRDVLAGKRIFYDAADTRMARDGYISCAVCHLDGFEDGQVWDFTDRGEGLRNTTSLLGRRGTGMGRVHWSANFDEIQDFEHDIRNAFGGTGFMSDEEFQTGTRDTTLGDEKQGVSEELDQLTAYVASLDRVHSSPHRAPDGHLTEAGWAGRSVFLRSGCDNCHSGPDFTDQRIHDVDTIRDTSGERLGEELEGIDTPTLRGIWETAPYLHDGSARTLRDVVTKRNSRNRHGPTRELSDEELDQLVAYLEQIDNTALEDEVEPPSLVQKRAESSGCQLRTGRPKAGVWGWFVVVLLVGARYRGRGFWRS
jgi:DNA-binding beta-propeller fold protein YncE